MPQGVEILSHREAKLLAIKFITEGLVQPEDLANLIHKALNDARPRAGLYCVIENPGKSTIDDVDAEVDYQPPTFALHTPTFNAWVEAD